MSAPDRLRGRILGFMIFGAVGLQPIGGLVTGGLTDLGGTRLAFLVSGGVVGAATLWALLSFRGSGARLRAHPEAPPA
jgi:hypothetical protein